MNKRCAYHQVLGLETDRCFTLRHAIQDLIDNKVIALPTRPSITNNPLPNNNFGKGPRINCLMTKEENKEDLSHLIYDLPECFMMTWEELMNRTSTTTIGYDIWNEILELANHQISTNGGRHFKPQVNSQHSQMGEETSNPKTLILMNQLKLPTSQGGETLQIPAFRDR